MISVEELERRMQPGVYSTKGFLGIGERLNDVLLHDQVILKDLNLTYDELAEPLSELLNTALQTNKTQINFFEVRLTKYKGYQICPWATDPHHQQCTAGGGVEFGSIDWVITNKRRKIKVSGPGLIVHLIRDHHFFEGINSPYRVEPLALAKLFELV